MKWIPVEDELPPLCEDVIFTDGKKVYFGWQENQPGEEPSWVQFKVTDRWITASVEDITHWMKKPSVPKFPGIEISRKRKQ